MLMWDLQTVLNNSTVFQKECKDKRAHIKYIPTFVSGKISVLLRRSF